ncbi:hypothetical protein GCM10011348_07960 [Marinobacterium nitratireducens]|uniref:CzcB-like barrel-sandwich hybrid domain-containing protein n=1 Tax=Marinobacterium nitratireducens TaxID=518897 RepID=A0A918DQQ8_9GAMM|nr:efflux RND transporter periplasmic adaptor subunit [Marinobacterium nitratireducens]GGO77733.1 hypothetical protein GCM10011348_07960 [Marinobacterium nitratireducens]
MLYRWIISLWLCLAATVAGAVTVRVAPLESLVKTVELSAPAQVVAEDHSVLSAQIGGLVESMPVRVGDHVSAGQLLVRLECSDYELALQQARASLDSLDARIVLARQQLERVKTLVKQRNVSVELRDQRQSELEQLTAERAGSVLSVEKAGLAVKRCSVNAPFDGIVTERPGSEGSLASSGTPLLRLLRDEALEVEAQVPMEQAGSLQQAAVLAFENNGRRYSLELRTVLPLVDSRTRTRRIRLGFSGEPALAGSSGRLLWQAPQPRLPAALVVRREGQLGLMLYRDGRAEFRPLPGALEGQAAAVDLAPDTLVIIEGQYAVNDGEPVQRQGTATAAAEE